MAAQYGRPLYFAAVVSSLILLLLFFLAYSQRSQTGCLPYFHTWYGLSANLECMSEICCTRHAENTARKNSPSVHHRTNLSGYIFATKSTCRQSEKNLLNSNISSTCPHSRMNVGPLAAEILSLENFCVLYFQRAASNTFQTCILNSH